MSSTQPTLNASKAEKFKSMVSLIIDYKDEHRIDLKDLETRLETNLQTGLTKAQAEANKIKYGRNILSEKKSIPW